MYRPGLVKLPRLPGLPLLGHTGGPEHAGEGDHEDQQLDQGQVQVTSNLWRRMVLLLYLDTLDYYNTFTRLCDWHEPGLED